MRIAIAASSALALALAVPVLAQNNGNGNGNGNSQGAKANPGKGPGAGKGNSGNPRGGPPAMRGNGNGQGNGKVERGQGPSPLAQRGNPVDRLEGELDRRVDRRLEDEVRRGANRAAREVTDRLGGDAREVLTRFDRTDRPLRGFCPPGLAKKNNGCQPPGQAKKLRSERFGGYYGSAYPQLSGSDWQYYDGYAYRPSRGGVIDALVPLVGGALFSGNQWPTAYDQYRAPAYYADYFGRNTDARYYYADQTLFSVDPKDQAITGIAALLTGDDITVGQRLPAGYDAYNVPYAYRDRYRDGPDAMYRYSDGYVYQVDPKTRVVAAVIDLLT